MLDQRPAPPFEAWPVQIHEEGLGFAWYAEPAAFVLQAGVEHGTVAFVDRFNDLIDHILLVRRDAVRAAGGVFILHDWRRMSGYDKEARTRAFERMRARERGYSRRTIVAVSPKSRLLRMAVEAGNLFATVTLRSTVELVTEPAQVLRRSGIQAPSPGSTFP